MQDSGPTKSIFGGRIGIEGYQDNRAEGGKANASNPWGRVATWEICPEIGIGLKCFDDDGHEEKYNDIDDLENRFNFSRIDGGNDLAF